MDSLSSALEFLLFAPCGRDRPREGPPRRPARRRLLFVLLAALCAFRPVTASPVSPAVPGNTHPDPIGYQVPVPALAAIVDAPREPRYLVSPDGRTVASVGQPTLPPIELVAEPPTRLAGIRFNARLRLDNRYVFGESLSLIDVATGGTRQVRGLPDPVRIVALAWSPDSHLIAVSVIERDAVRLWLVDPHAAQARLATAEPLNAILGNGFAWLSGNERLLLRLRPEREGPPPARSVVPLGPNVQSAEGGGAPSQLVTYEDLLKTAFDENLLDYYLSAQLAVLDLKSGVRRFGPVERLLEIAPSPDGQYVLLGRLERPYSRLVPLSNFPRTTEVWDLRGERVRTVAHNPVFDVVPPGPDAVPPGPREFSWRADHPHQVIWVEAADGGDPRREAPIRDVVYALDPVGSDPARALVQLPRRFAGLYWGRDDLALAVDWTWKSRDQELWRFAPGDPGRAPERVLAWKSEDRYRLPGRLLTEVAPNGYRLLRLAKESVFFEGDGATPEGDRPFFNRFDLKTGTTTTLWRSAAPYFEHLVVPLSPDGTRFITRRESVDEPPNLIRHDTPGDAGTPLTHFADPLPEFRGVQKRIIRYQRADGLTLTGDLYLPPGYDSARDGPLPTLLWAYPQEFKSAQSAAQNRGSPFKFNLVSFWGPLPFLMRGFAVLDNPTMPIVGEGDAEPNDTYVTQLVADAQAAIDELVRLGVTDRDRVAVGGHSYGAFMTANLLAHTRLFKAGIARSGAYNRTLTPFGFQAEDRTFWQAKDVYLAMSAFVNADGIHDPLLLIHGEADNNPGTYPIQSERMYQALKGLGRPTRLVMLPAESHGYSARESILHMLWEEDRWLERYVKTVPETRPLQDPEKG